MAIPDHNGMQENLVKLVGKKRSDCHSFISVSFGNEGFNKKQEDILEANHRATHINK